MITVSTTPRRAVSEQIARLRTAIGRLDRRLRQHTSTSLSPTQLSIFGSIQRFGPLTVTDLVGHERLSAATISKTVTVLEEGGLVERIRDQQDRRIWRIGTTAKGEDWSKSLREERNTWLAEQFLALSPAEQKTLLAALPILEHLVGTDD